MTTTRTATCRGCGHDRHDHANGAGRCAGKCVDDRFTTTYRCVCPYYTEVRV